MKPTLIESYKIYAIICPDTLKVRYIGRTTREDVRIRLAEHMQYNTVGNKLYAWLKSLKAKNPIMVVIEDGLTRDASADREKFWIRSFCESGAKLFNIHGREGAWTARVKGVQVLDATGVIKELLNQLKAA